MANKRRRYDNKSAMAAGVDHLLRQQGRLSKVPSTIGTAGASTTETAHPIEPTYLVAASDARTAIRNVADFRCNGTDDQVEIQLALDALTSANGRVVLTEGTFNLTPAPASDAIFVDFGHHLQGVGDATQLWIANTSASWNEGINMATESQISDMTINISNSTAGQFYAVFCGGQRCRINRIRFEGMKHIDLDDLAYINGTWDTVIDQCDFYDLGSQVHGGG